MKLERSSSLYINKKILFCLWLFLVYPLTLNAQILITEVMYNPEGNDDDREWIEAINLGENINVKTGKSGWRIFDGKNRILKGENFTWDKNEIIIFVQNANRFLSEYPQVKNKLIEVSFYLKNKEGKIRIIDENKNVVTEFEYNSNLGGNGNGYSLIHENGKVIEGRTYKGSPGIYPEPLQRTEKPKDEETPFQNINSPNTNQQEVIKTTTPSEEKNETFISTSSLLDTYQSTLQTTSSILDQEYTLLITEFLPNLKGKDIGEFVEIYNYGDKKIDLNKVYLIIGDKKVKLYGEIEPKSYKVFYNSELNFNIKNSGDTLKLVDEKNNIIFSISYQGKSKEEKSLARNKNGNWLWVNPTPGEENVFIEKNNKTLISDQEFFSENSNLSKEDLLKNNKANAFTSPTENRSKTSNIQILLIGLILSTIFTVIFVLLFK